MRQKELRIALVCYGGVSLAIYMHGVTKELWKLARASRSVHSGDGAEAEVEAASGVEAAYRRLLDALASDTDTRLRVLPDILAGASAGGINAIFLAQAIHSGRSLEPLTDLWLECADVERLLDPEADKGMRYLRGLATPLVRYFLHKPGNMVSDAVAPETEEEVRAKLSRLVRSRWFAPPFSGIGFSRLLADAFDAMERTPASDPLLPPGHPLDLFVTATDFKGYIELLRLHSPPVVEESEHRMPIGFSARTPPSGGQDIADPLNLIFAARSTASFPGAFPPLRIAEIDDLAAERDRAWTGRDAFLNRIMPAHVQHDTLDAVSLIDGSVLVNAPFSEALGALAGRPAQREVDRRFVYIDPRPDRAGRAARADDAPVGFFGAIFGSLSTIPREQPIRDNLEALQEKSREAARLQQLLAALRPEVEGAVDRLFGRTLFLDRPTPRRLRIWRARAQQAAAEQAGYAFNAYAQVKYAQIVERLATRVADGAADTERLDQPRVLAILRAELAKRGLTTLGEAGGGASDAAIAFFRAHDIGFRIRRLRMLARRLSREWEVDPEIDDAARDVAQDVIFGALSVYFDAEKSAQDDPQWQALARKVADDPGAVLDYLEARGDLISCDDKVETMLAEGLEAMPRQLKRRMLLAYLGFPFYDVATLPLLREETSSEFEPVKIDRISPDDAHLVAGVASLRGTEFYNFGAFFSRAYRENDYLLGRLHGAERMVDLVVSSVSPEKGSTLAQGAKIEICRAILSEERDRLPEAAALIAGIEAELDRQAARSDTPPPA